MTKNNSPARPTIGIVGAGKLGITLAQLLRQAGLPVLISSSRPAAENRLTVSVLAPGAVAASTNQLAAQADIIILALPLGKFRQLPAQLFDGKIVIDAMNYWWEVDGPRADILPDGQASSQAVQDWFAGARVVKAFSHMGYHHLRDEARPAGTPGRKAIAVASDNANDAAATAALVDHAGFDPLILPNLASGQRLEPGQPGFGVNLTRSELAQLLLPSAS